MTRVWSRIEAASLGWLLVSRIVTGNDCARALTGIGKNVSQVDFSKMETCLLKNWVSYTHDKPLDLKIERSVQPKNTFNKRCVVWVISVAPETARRLQAVKLRYIELADCPKRVRLPWRSPQGSAAAYRPIFDIHPASSCARPQGFEPGPRPDRARGRPATTFRST